MTQEPTKLTRDDIIQTANEIRQDYARQYLKLTIRQLYYRFVAMGLMASGQKNYKRIVNALSVARLDGRFPLDGVEDRGRDIHAGEFTRRDDDLDSADDLAKERVSQLPEDIIGYDRWFGQPYHISVWVEKEALAGVFEGPCSRLGVSMFACRGYPSISALWDWVQKTQRAMKGFKEKKDFRYRNIDMQFREMHEGRAKEAVVLYFGDHDPDGWEIPRSALRNVYAIQGLSRKLYPVSLRRIALNMDQIQQYDPPPFEAKYTSSRYQSYIDEHGTDDAWELDALEPSVLRQLIEDSVEEYFDEDIHADNEERADVVRQDLRLRMMEEDWLADAFGMLE